MDDDGIRVLGFSTPAAGAQASQFFVEYRGV